MGQQVHPKNSDESSVSVFLSATIEGEEYTTADHLQKDLSELDDEELEVLASILSHDADELKEMAKEDTTLCSVCGTVVGTQFQEVCEDCRSLPNPQNQTSL